MISGRENMLKAFYSITKRVQNKIYIYGVDRDSITVFTNLALWGGDICGFIDDEEERYVGEYFMNRPIIEAKQIEDMRDAVIVVPDAIEKNVVKEKLGEDIEIVYYNEIIVPNQELKKKDIYIYGIGEYGEKMFAQCCKHGIKIKAVCVTQKGSVTEWNHLPVLEISEIDTEEDCAFIIATVSSTYQEQMMETLKDYRGDKYVYNYILQHHIIEGRFFQIIGKAVIEHKKIWLYGKNQDLKERVTDVLLRYSVDIQGEINDLYALPFHSIEDTVVVIADSDESEVEKACNILDSLGYALEKWNYTSLAGEIVKCEGKICSSGDLLLGWSNISDNMNYPGFIVYGDDDKQNIRIMVLGNSTSTDGIYRTESWVKFFYQKLLDEKYHITIFNGSACGYGCTKALLRLLRDGAYMDLDYVINLSGINNVTRPKNMNYFSSDWSNSRATSICGLESKESLYEFWFQIMKVMKSVTELYGAKFYPFLQPMAINEEVSLVKTVMHEMRGSRKEILEFRKMALQQENSIYTSAIDFFDKQSDMFIDTSHYSSRGNKLVADLIYKTMIKEEGELKKQKELF